MERQTDLIAGLRLDERSGHTPIGQATELMPPKLIASGRQVGPVLGLPFERHRVLAMIPIQ